MSALTEACLKRFGNGVVTSMAWDRPKALQYAVDFDFSPYAKNQLVQRELARWLEIAGRSIGYDTSMPMLSKKVDEAWHAFILSTREYARYCEKVFGQFIHHCPASRLPKTAKVDPPEAFVRRYTELFGEHPPREVWGDLPKEEKMREKETVSQMCDCYGCTGCTS